VTFGVSIASLISAALAWLSIRKLDAHYTRERSATERARNAADMRDELLAVVSHDLRTPLQTISIAASCLETAELASLDRRRVAAISGATDRMQHLIEQLLDVARIERGRLALQRKPVSADALVEAVLSLFQERAEKERIELTKRTDTRLEVEADRERILQALSNLVANALRFTPAGGEIKVTAEVHAAVAKFAVTDRLGTRRVRRRDSTSLRQIPPGPGEPRRMPGAGSIHLQEDRCRPWRTDRRREPAGEGCLILVHCADSASMMRPCNSACGSASPALRLESCNVLGGLGLRAGLQIERR
jgi:signal transduction histidine kinase